MRVTVPRMAGRHRQVGDARKIRSGRRRRSWMTLTIVAGVLLIGGIPTLIALRHLDHEYGPIDAGPFGGPYTFRNLEYAGNGGSIRLVDRVC